jgi:4-amino-4-deoxy-L-arabinose transferase-like glycosyltransferase
LVYRVIGEMTDYAGGALASLMMLAIGSFRRAALLYIATTPLMLLVLLALWAFLHWRRATTAGERARWSIAIGFFTAWAGLTRPLDAMCFAIPIGVGMIVHLVHAQTREQDVIRTWSTSFGCLILGALPFLTLQLVYNHGVTGSFLVSPWTAYTKTYDPYDGMAIGKLDLSKQPQTTLPQKVEFSTGYTKAAAIERRSPDRLRRWVHDDLPAEVNVLLPHPLLIVLLPVGLLSLCGRARRVLYASLPLVVLAYAFYTFSVPHYVVVAAPAAALGVVLGVETLAAFSPRTRSYFRAALYPAIVGLCLTQLPHVNRFLMDDMFRPPEPKQIADLLAHLDHKPAVVLFHYAPGINNPHVEPVYNTDVAWPDDAEVIRAHDLGPKKDRHIFDYYAQRQPQRFFYLFDRADNSLHPLGFAKDLASSPPSTMPH